MVLKRDAFDGVEKTAFFVYAAIGRLSSVLQSSPCVLGYFLAIKDHLLGTTEVLDPQREHKEMLKSYHPAHKLPRLVQLQHDFCWK